jgi:multiple sugar transport system substrate-binding protein
MWRFLVVAGLAAAFLVAAAQDSPSLEPVEFWTWQASSPDLAQDYQMASDNLRVKVRRFSSGAETYQALLTSLKSGKAPDAVRLEYAFLPLLQHQNAVLDLEPTLPATAAADFPAWAWKQVSVGRGVYALPVDSSPVVLVYRSDLLERYKLAVPTTWTQLASASEQIFKASAGKVKLFNMDARSSLWWLALTQASGARPWVTAETARSYVQQLEDAPARRVAAALAPLWQRGRVTSFATGSLDEARALRDGTLVMSAMPMSAALSLAKVLRIPSNGAKYRIAGLPGGGSADWGGSACAVTTQSQSPEAALRFCSWLSRDTAAQRKSWARDGLLSVMPDSSNETPVALRSFYGGAQAGVTFSKLREKIQSQTWVPWLPLTDAVYRQLMRSVMTGDLTLTQALERWQATVLLEAKKAGFSVR